ncbi:MAG TPA: FAD-dependent monooxygenase [Burkholderiales bacterium]|nr:FAD-dependent monooxygenase [Burkholderiales bacterium]
MKFDVVIVGGGTVGSTLAAALSHAQLSLALVEPRGSRELPGVGFDSRVYALNGSSRRFLEKHGVWQRMQADRIAPVREMRVFGDDASEIGFSAYRSHVPELAAIVEEANLQQAIRCTLARQENLTLIAAGFERAIWAQEAAELSLSDGTRIEAALVVAADGADSRVRQSAAVEATTHHYAQTGVVANFHVDKAHRDTACQWFVEAGVLALLPLPGEHVSMVWSTDEAIGRELIAASPEELANRVEAVSGGLTGRMHQVGVTAGFPLRRMRASTLIGPRLALVGDTAHNVHPLAGQGLNLGLADAQILSETLVARGAQNDCGAHALLRRYERGRREDLLAMEAVTDGLQALFASPLPGVRRLRNAGLKLVDGSSPLKRLLVKRALG